MNLEMRVLHKAFINIPSGCCTWRLNHSHEPRKDAGRKEMESRSTTMTNEPRDELLPFHFQLISRGLCGQLHISADPGSGSEGNLDSEEGSTPGGDKF